MGYRDQFGCLWLLLLVLLLGGTPLLVGLARVLLSFLLLASVGTLALRWWMRHQALGYARSQSHAHKRFVELLIALLVRCAELDGQLDRREVTAIRHFFQYDLGYRGERLVWIRDLIKESRRNPVSVEAVCSEIRARYGLHERFIVMQVLGRVAEADGAVTGSELGFLEEVARLLGLAPFVGGFGFGPRPEQAPPTENRRVEEALAVLGLESEAASEQIKQAWRTLSLENHPDRVAHLGPEFRRLAEERMRKINAAYDVLKEAGMVA